MKRTSFLFFLTILLSSLIFTSNSFASQVQGNLKTQVNAQVGQNYLNLSGYISPYASIVLSSNKVFYKSTTANQFGNFNIPNVLISSNFSSFCLDAIDFKRVGTSEVCISVAPQNGIINKGDIFLPPTLGLARTKISEGSNALIFGYSMPNAKVSLHVSDGEVLGAQTDASGYYKIELKNVKAGKYVLYPTAVLNNKTSLDPSKKFELEALSTAQRSKQQVETLFGKFWRLLTSISILIWLILLLIILIIILLIYLYLRRKDKSLLDIFPFFLWKRRRKKEENQA